MFPVYSSVRKVFFSSLLILAIFAITSMQAAYASDFSYNDIEIRKITAPDNFENAVRYRITYWYKDEGASLQVFPSREERERDADIILSHLLRRFIDEEYYQNGKALDEHVVEAADMGQILDLISRDHLSFAWHDENINNLRQFLHKYNKDLLLFTVNMYLDYAHSNGYFSGNDINPIIVNFKNDGRSPDEATFIIVNVSDRRK